MSGINQIYRRMGLLTIHIKTTTDYAIRILLYLYLNKNQNVSTASEISKTMGIPPTYQMKLMQQLKQAGFVQVIRGQYGGYRISDKGNDISLYDVVQLMEPEKINRCLEDDKYCSRDGTPHCTVCRFYSLMQKKWDDSLKSMTLEILSSDPNELILRQVLDI